MFRWCSYCQRCLGEFEPYDDYAISHGVCESCLGHLEHAEVAPVKGLDLFEGLFESARRGDFAACHAAVDAALGQGWRPSDAAVGLLQPALYRFGRLWEKGEASVAQENAFSDWCELSLSLLERRAPPAGRARVLIAPIHGNAHTLGPRFAALRLRDLGVTARALSPNLADAEIAEICRREEPEILGLSASLKEGLPRARGLAALVRGLPLAPGVVLGGLAARMPEAADMVSAPTPEALCRLLKPRATGGAA